MQIKKSIMSVETLKLSLPEEAERCKWAHGRKTHTIRMMIGLGLVICLGIIEGMPRMAPYLRICINVNREAE
jgi:hypothetical protein